MNCSVIIATGRSSKYNGDVGQLHKTDAAGNRISLRFATLLARKAIARRERSPQRVALAGTYPADAVAHENAW